MCLNLNRKRPAAAPAASWTESVTGRDSGGNGNRLDDGFVRLGRVIELTVVFVDAFAVAEADGVNNRAQMVAGDFHQREHLVKIVGADDVEQGTVSGAFATPVRA